MRLALLSVLLLAASPLGAEPPAAREELLERLREAHEAPTRYVLAGISEIVIHKDFPGAFRIHEALVQGGRDNRDITLSSEPQRSGEFALRIGLDVSAPELRVLLGLVLAHGQPTRIGAIDDPDPESSIAMMKRRTVALVHAGASDRPADATLWAALRDPGLTQAALRDLLQPSKGPDDRRDRQFAIAQALVDKSDRRDMALAQQMLERIIAAQPDRMEAYAELARAHMKAVPADEAFRDSAGLRQADLILGEALRMAPEHADLRVLLGYVRTEQERPQEALAELQRAQALGTPNLWLHHNLGLAHERAGHDRIAIDHYRKAVARKPRNADDRDRFPIMASWARLIEALIRVGDYSAADQAFLKRETDLAEVREPGARAASRYQLFRLQHFGDYEGVLARIARTRERALLVDNLVVALAQVYKAQALAERGDPEAAGWISQARITLQDPVTFAFQAALGSKSRALLATIHKDVVSLDTRDRGGTTVLGRALTAKDTAMVGHLLAAGASPDVPVDATGHTALMVAAIQGDAALVRQLLARGARADLRDLSGRTALDYARQCNCPDVLAALAAVGV